MRSLLPLLLLAVACNGDAKDAQDSTPEVVDCSTRPTDIPSARGEVAGVWDEDNGRLLVFGGDNGTPVDCASRTDFVGETWAFHPDCGNFELLTSDAGPSPRGRYAAALDPVNGRMIIHGGRFRDGTSGAYTLLDDTWAFDFATNTWTELAAEGPGARTNHVAVVAGGKFILYGGNTSTNGASFSPQEDTWALDLGSLEWARQTTTGEVGARLFHAATVSDDGATMYVYGGGDEGAFFGPFFGDLWALDLDTRAWTELDDGRDRSAPLGRIWPSLHYRDGALVMWAGHDDGSLGNTNEVWTFDLGGGGWSSEQVGDVQTANANGFCDFPADFVEPDLTAPERRNAHAAALTPDGHVVTFGGKTDCGLINDAWSYDLDAGVWALGSRATVGEICLRAYAECETMCF